MAMPSIFNSSILLSSKTSFPATSRCLKATPTQPLLRGTHRSLVARAFDNDKVNLYEVLKIVGVKEESALVHLEKFHTHGIYQRCSLDLENALIIHFGRGVPKLPEGLFFDGRDLGFMEKGRFMKVFTLPEDLKNYELRLKLNWEFKLILPRESSELDKPMIRDGTLLGCGEKWSVVEKKDEVVISIWLNGISKQKIMLLDPIKNNIVGLHGDGELEYWIGQFILNPKYSYGNSIEGIQVLRRENLFRVHMPKV